MHYHVDSIDLERLALKCYEYRNPTKFSSLDFPASQPQTTFQHQTKLNTSTFRKLAQHGYVTFLDHSFSSALPLAVSSALSRSLISFLRRLNVLWLLGYSFHKTIWKRHTNSEIRIRSPAPFDYWMARWSGYHVWGWAPGHHPLRSRLGSWLHATRWGPLS